MKHEIRIAGSGGQGVVFAGTILGRSACVYEGLNVIQSQSYGAEARGGRCRADAILSDGEIYDIIVTKPDVLLIMNQTSMDFYNNLVADCPTILINSDIVKKIPETNGRVFKIPATKIANDLGTPAVSNMAMLGGFSAVTEIIRGESIEKSLRETLGKDIVERNIHAVREGFKQTE
ncbi:MAG: 2-oxoacid:acceptor oxidoreductase family protein [Thermoplasmata archaeon]